MRRYYFSVEVDIGSSGVQDFSLAELRSLLGIGVEDLDNIVFHDSETLGGPGLRQAIADRWGGGDATRVMATHGGTEANYLVMNGLLEPGDEVVVLDPCYQQLYAIAETLGCRLKKWPLRFERGFAPQLEDARKVIGERTRMVVVNFPHNPTGASITVEEQRELVECVAEVGAYLVWDVAFAELTYDRPPLPDANLLYERAISMGTLSKAYGLPGLRVGWCLAPPEVLERMIRVRDYMTLHLSPLVEFLARKAIENSDVLTGMRVRQAKTNMEIVRRWAEEHQDMIEWVPPQGGVSTFPRLTGVPDVDVFCHRLGEEQRVLLVPGSCFGAPQHVRLGFGGGTAALEEGLRRFSTMLRAASTAATAMAHG
jgi:capreomycidine synthase